jgi:hypothetical protein
MTEIFTLVYSLRVRQELTRVEHLTVVHAVVRPTVFLAKITLGFEISESVKRIILRCQCKNYTECFNNAGHKVLPFIG